MEGFTILQAYKNGELSHLLNTTARAWQNAYPDWPEAACRVWAAADIVCQAMREGDITIEERRNYEAIDDLYWWLIEDALDTLHGTLIQLSGSRSLLYEVGELQAGVVQSPASLDSRITAGNT